MALALPFDVVTVLSLGIVVLLAGYVVGTWKYDFFSTRKVSFVPPVPFLGNMAPFFLRERSFPDLLQDWYKKLRRHSYGGIFYYLRPVLILRDPHLIKRVLVKDFDHFVDNGNEITEDIDPLLGKSLICLKGKCWKRMRLVLNPAFTMSKMKYMMSPMCQSAESLIQHLKDRLKQRNRKADNSPVSVDMKDLFTRFISDVIATCAFGFEFNSFKNGRNSFYRTGKAVDNATNQQSFVIWGYHFFPRLMACLKLHLLSNKVRQLFQSLFRITLRMREKEHIVKPDMIHLLMRIQRRELRADSTEEDSVLKLPPDECDIRLTEDYLTAQAVLFPMAGLEPMALLLCWTVHMLATHPSIQMRLLEEINTVLGDKSIKLTHEKLQRMKYLDMVLSEILRLFPPTVVIKRQCVKSYTINATGPDPELHLKKQQMVWIPVFALHRDQRYFPDPERFDPERFRDENKAMIRPFTYLPFGAGPRNCIGSFFALMVVKVALVYLLSNFILHQPKKMKNRPRFDKQQMNLSLEGGFWLDVQSINKE